MSVASVTSSLSPIQRRDIRSDSIPSKRDRDQIEKWAAGHRPSAGVMTTLTGEPVGGSESQREKVRPNKQWSQISSEQKSHANITPKPTLGRGFMHNASANRAFRKLDAAVESSSPSSMDILDLLPSYANHTRGSLHVAADAGVFYSFDRKESPHGMMDLSNLIDKAEKKWESERTERIVKGEYEVLDHDGKSVSVGKRGKSPKQNPKNVVEKVVEDEDDFELV